MDLDNPSYFSVPTDEPDCNISQIRRKNRIGNSESSSSEVSLTRQLTPPRYNNRRELRNLLRSVSTNSADSNQELLILGEPRLSDMAPDLAFKHPSRSNSLKRSQENGQYLLLSTEVEVHQEDDLLEEDEVFLAEDSARYTNFTVKARVSNGNSSPKDCESPRRHSVGTFSTSRDSVASSARSFKDDFTPMMQENVASTSAIDEHSLRHMSYPRKRCLKCTKGTLQKQPTNMDDILIVSRKSSEPAGLWVEYFNNYFEQMGLSVSTNSNRKSFKLQNVYLEDSLTPKVEDKAFQEGATGVKLQIVVLCPTFLEFISQHPEESQKLTKLLLPDRTLALLLGVNDSDFEKHKSALPTYFQWQRHSVGQDQDQTFTKEFLGHAIAILSRIWKKQNSVIGQDKSCFSVTPKKVRQGQTSVFVLLTHPLQKEDIVKISVERNGDLQEIESIKRRNPYIVKISLPDNMTDMTAIVHILVEKNGSMLGSRPIKCESKMMELGQILRGMINPIEFMCQTVGFSPADREQLDNWLVQEFQKNLPPHLNLIGSHSTPFAASVSVHKHSNEEYPTLLHFAAKFGLEKLATVLMDCPGANIAFEIRNCHDMTPTDIADNNGHYTLSNMLKMNLNMNEVTSTYIKLKEIISKHSNEMDPNGYMTPNEIVENVYKMCPAPRPVNPEMTSSYPTNRSPAVTPSSEASSPFYMATGRNPQAFSREDLRLDDLVAKADPQKRNARSPSPNARTKHVIEDKAQQELAEIINDFKNKVHSLSEVEKLVEAWTKRNDVQKSFKEKQEHLKVLRREYENAQKLLEQNQKCKKRRPSIVENILWKVFSRSNSKRNLTQQKSNEESTMVQFISGPPLQLNQSARPISSLSTSSSGSSARMSTISGCSVGDSGTHSDIEDRKINFGNSHSDQNCLPDCKDETLNKSILDWNYTPVPIPKPVKFPAHFETIEENKATRADQFSSQQYIQFPPNGQPVEGFTDSKTALDSPSSPHNEYMNIPLPPKMNTSQHDYMNMRPPT
ncbi:uncharacterized protein LOC126734365 isoform X2 [Anthonomus grandis grandis]|uniref:uncharacterized protein LOC126734365 isoform X2 n=1 Tax=Anthonomus grandis grandis TaxID=2921223 RepID=UPI0021663D12|nr:uncharacterized protein LOC126734365 isoform X2 [Anthonomus grandis grandis]